MPDDLVTIATFLNLGEAKLAQGKLAAAGVEASVRDENAMNLHIGMAMWGIQLQVPDRQVVRALEILDDFLPVASEDDDSDSEIIRCCPQCESMEIRLVADNRSNQISLWSSALPFPEPPTVERQRWRCLACGHQWEEDED